MTGTRRSGVTNKKVKERKGEREKERKKERKAWGPKLWWSKGETFGIVPVGRGGALGVAGAGLVGKF